MVVRANVRFRADDIWDAPEDGNRYEVIDGKLYIMPPPRIWHQNVVSQLLFFLLPYVVGRQLGKVFTAPVGVVLDDEDGVQPDIIFIAHDRLDIVSQRRVEGAPDLVIEVLSPSTQARDRGIKMRRYAAAGVRYYWIVAQRTRRIEEYRLGLAGFELIGYTDIASVFRSEIFPDLEIPVQALWE